MASEHINMINNPSQKIPLLSSLKIINEIRNHENESNNVTFDIGLDSINGKRILRGESSSLLLVYDYVSNLKKKQ